MDYTSVPCAGCSEGLGNQLAHIGGCIKMPISVTWEKTQTHLVLTLVDDDVGTEETAAYPLCMAPDVAARDMFQSMCSHTSSVLVSVAEKI